MTKLISDVSMTDEEKRWFDEFTIDQNNFLTCSFRALSRILCIDRSSIIKPIKSVDKKNKLYIYLLDSGFEDFVLSSWLQNGIPIEGVIIIAQYYAYKTKRADQTTRHNASNLLNIILKWSDTYSYIKDIYLKYVKNSIQSIPKPVKSKNPEKSLQERFVNRFYGRTEVVTPVGRIDILTDNHIFEIKNVRAWKSAVGQLLMYGHYYPNHRKVIYLFGLTNFSDMDLINYHCQEFGIDIVTTDTLDRYMYETKRRNS